MADSGGWVQFWSTALGGGLSILGSFLAQWMTARAGHEAQKREKEEAERQRKTEAYLQILTDLQDEMARMVSAALKAKNRRVALSNVAPATGSEEEPFPEEALEPSYQFLAAHMRVETLYVRVQDDRLRSLLASLNNAALRVKNTPTQGESSGLTDGMYRAFREANDRIGEIIRSHTRAGPPEGTPDDARQ
jgi:hypothetical protein